MTIEKKNGKACIEYAKKLAKACGVDVLCWSDKVGKESISMNGEGDRLLLLQKEMEKEGWYTWPVDEEQEGSSMDFGMMPPPAGLKGKPSPSEQSTQVVYTGTDFQYSGFATTSILFYLFCLVAVGFLIASFCNKNPCALQTDWKGFLWAAVIIVLLGLRALTDWVFVFADHSKLVIRRLIFRKEREMPLSNIKKIQYHTLTGRDMRTKVGTCLVIYLKSGKYFNLFLPKQAQDELVAFIRRKIS